jgi:hypothetical protein
LSHSKHDDYGSRIAREIRAWISGSHGLASFFDVHDIPAGLAFQCPLAAPIDEHRTGRQDPEIRLSINQRAPKPRGMRSIADQDYEAERPASTGSRPTSRNWKISGVRLDQRRQVEPRKRQWPKSARSRSCCGFRLPCLVKRCSTEQTDANRPLESGATGGQSVKPKHA